MTAATLMRLHEIFNLTILNAKCLCSRGENRVVWSETNVGFFRTEREDRFENVLHLELEWGNLKFPQVEGKLTQMQSTEWPTKVVSVQ